MTAAADILDRLETRYSPPKWVTFRDLRRGPGFARERTADFFAFHAWPSEGHRSVAVEVKVSKADFRRELANPDKRAPFEEVSSEFWFAAPRGIIPEEELPEGLGLLETWGDKLRIRRHASQHRDRGPDRDLWVMMLRAQADEIANRLRDLDRFAEFLGRSVSFSDLLRLAEKAGQIKEWEIRQRIRQEDAAERRRLSKEGTGYTEATTNGRWFGAVQAARRFCRHNFLGGRDLSPEELTELLEKLADLGDLRTVAGRIERAGKALYDLLDSEAFHG